MMTKFLILVAFFISTNEALNSTKQVTYQTFSTKLVRQTQSASAWAVNYSQLSTERSKILLSDIVIDYQKFRLCLILVFICLLALTPVGFLVWIVKKFGKLCFMKVCGLLCRKKTLTSSSKQFEVEVCQKSDSALSGECGCMIRVRKDTNHNHNHKRFNSQRLSLLGECEPKKLFVKKNILAKSNKKYTLQRVRSSACMLVAVKSSHTNKTISNKVTLSRIESMESNEEDLSEYGEYSKKSLNDLSNFLCKLELANGGIKS